MNSPYRSLPVLAVYDGGEPDAPPAPPIEPPVVETPPEDPPKRTYEELEARLKELEGIAERESAWTAREAELTASLAERDSRFADLKSRHDQAAIRTAITEAAVSHDAFSVPQILGLLGHRASVAEDGSVVVDVGGVSMAAQDVLAQMKEDRATFGNLFKNPMSPGIGGHSGSGAGLGPGSGGKIDISRLTSKEYRELRRTNPRALGLDRDPEVRR